MSQDRIAGALHRLSRIPCDANGYLNLDNYFASDYPRGAPRGPNANGVRRRLRPSQLILYKSHVLLTDLQRRIRQGPPQPMRPVRVEAAGRGTYQVLNPEDSLSILWAWLYGAYVDAIEVTDTTPCDSTAATASSSTTAT